MTHTKGLYFLPLGGSGEIGMNLNLYAYDDQWLMVDLGITFGDSLGVDIIMPNPQYIVERRDKLVGLLLTHAHEDHIGAVPYLWSQLKCPLYATPFTAALLRHKLQDAGLLHEAKIHEIPLSGTRSIGPFDIEMVRLTHSIPEPNGVLIKTPVGSVFHTGDWKIDPDPMVGERTDVDALKRIGDAGVLAMVCDSTNVFQEGVSGSEKAVRENLIDAIKNHSLGRIVVTCFASNVARLESIAVAAAENGRQVAIVGRSFIRMDDAARGNGYLTDIARFISLKEAANLDPKKVLYVCTGSQGEAKAALSRISMEMHPEVHLDEGDTVIFSSRIIPGNEKEIARVKNRLIRRGIEVMTQDHYDLHVSGHPARDELKQMYEWVRPHISIPVHGELRHMVEHGRLAKKCGIPEVIIPENGTLVRLYPDPAEIVEEVPTGRLALDGDVIIRLDHPALKERGKLAAEGCVFVTLKMAPEGDLEDRPELSVLGIVNVDNCYQAIITAIEDAIHGLDTKGRKNIDRIKEVSHSAIRKTIQSFLGKKPQVVVHIVD
jgi:ribonuclease J